jgi:hypothetical protein
MPFDGVHFRPVNAPPRLCSSLIGTHKSFSQSDIEALARRIGPAVEHGVRRGLRETWMDGCRVLVAGLLNTCTGGWHRIGKQEAISISLLSMSGSDEESSSIAIIGSGGGVHDIIKSPDAKESKLCIQVSERGSVPDILSGTQINTL